MATTIPLAARVSKVRIQVTPPDDRPPAPIANVRPVSPRAARAVLATFVPSEQDVRMEMQFRSASECYLEAPLANLKHSAWDLEVATRLARGASFQETVRAMKAHPLNVRRGIIRHTRRCGLSVRTLRGMALGLETEAEVRAMLLEQVDRYRELCGMPPRDK